MGSLRDLLEQHQLADISVSRDSASEVSLERRKASLQDSSQVAAGELDSNIDILDLVRILQADLHRFIDVNDEADILVGDGDSIQT